MDNFRAAFGICSVYRYHRPEPETLASYSCMAPYQLMAVKGPCLLSIMNFKDTPFLPDALIKIAGKIIWKIPPPDYKLISVFQQKIFSEHWCLLKLVYGKWELQNAYPRWLPVLSQLNFQYVVYVLPVPSQKYGVNISLIQFTGAEAIRKFNDKFGINDPDGQIAAWNKKKDNQVIYAVKKLPEENEVLSVESALPFDNMDKFVKSL